MVSADTLGRGCGFSLARSVITHSGGGGDCWVHPVGLFLVMGWLGPALFSFVNTRVVFWLRLGCQEKERAGETKRERERAGEFHCIERRECE